MAEGRNAFARIGNMILTGTMSLTAEKRAKKTIISSCYYQGALKVTRPVYLDPDAPSVYMMHVGGGYLDGDIYETEIHVQSEAELSVTTQSHTKVYKTPKEPVQQRTAITLGKNSVLEYLPDPLIAYEEARFSQETKVSMESGSVLIYSDIVTPGWAPDGRFFRYDWIRSKFKVYKNEKLVMFDHLKLEPDEQINGLMQMEGFTHTGMLAVLHEEITADRVDEIYELLTKLETKPKYGISILSEPGFLLRVLASSTQEIEKVIFEVHRFIRQTLLQKEEIRFRKY